MLNGSRFWQNLQTPFALAFRISLKQPEQRHLKTADEAAVYTRLQNDHGVQKHVC